MNRKKYLSISLGCLAALLCFNSYAFGQPGGSADDQSVSQPTEWELEQEWLEGRDVEAALRILKELRDDTEFSLEDEGLLRVLNWQLRFEQLNEAEKTFNQIPESFVVSESENQFPFALALKLNKVPHQYDILEEFINRPTLVLDQTQREIGQDRINMWRVFQQCQARDLEAAIRYAEQISVSPELLDEPFGQRDYKTSEYLCVSAYNTIFGVAVSAGNAELAAELLDKFEYDSDRRTLLRHREDSIRELEPSEAREQLLSNLRESYQERRKVQKQQVKDKDFAAMEESLKGFGENPDRNFKRAIQLMQIYQELGRSDDLARWLDLVVATADTYRSPDPKLFELFAANGRESQAIEYFGPLALVSSNRFQSVQAARQPLCRYAVKLAKEGKLLQVAEVISSIKEPVWRSAALAKMSQVVASSEPELSRQWWDESNRVLDLVEDTELFDLRLGRNYVHLSLASVQEDFDDMMARFKDKSRAASSLERWMQNSIGVEELPSSMVRKCVDIIANFDARKLEGIVGDLQQDDRYEDCVYAAMRMQEDTDIGYFSYVNYQFKQFFEYAIDRMSIEQIETIFDRQLAKHRGVVMKAAMVAAKDQKRDDIVELIWARMDDTDDDLRLFNKLAGYFIKNGNRDKLKTLLELPWPESQFLDDDPVGNNWRLEINGYRGLPQELAAQIGGTEMLEFAESIERPEARAIAYQQALLQVAEDGGLAKVEQLCNKMVDRRQRAQILLSVVEKYLSRPVKRKN